MQWGMWGDWGDDGGKWKRVMGREEEGWSEKGKGKGKGKGKRREGRKERKARQGGKWREEFVWLALFVAADADWTRFVR